MSRYARIIGTGSYVPAQVFTNDDLSRMLGEEINDFVYGVIGIKQRHLCAADESTADLAVNAARAALQAAGVNAGANARRQASAHARLGRHGQHDRVH